MSAAKPRVSKTNLPLRAGQIVFLVILAAYLAYAAVYIFKTSFVVEGERYFVLFDDAMISMRYARNLANGDGLVWNPGGERVEGYTNPLWVVFMALFHLLPIPASQISLLVQASGALFLAANLYFVYRIAERLSGSWIAAALAVILTAFYQPLNNWGLQGMEVSLLVLMTSTATWMALESLRTGRFNAWIFLLLGVSTLVRTDMAVPFLVILGFLFLAQPAHRRQTLLWGAGLLVLFLGGQTLFRLAYYGDVLPNTYYLKVSGYPLSLRILRGLYVLYRFAWDANWLLFLFPLVVLVFRRDREVLLLFLLVLGQIAYSVYVGGDAWEHRGGANRYISIVMPLFFVLFVLAADLLRGSLAAQFRSRGAAAASLPVMIAFVLAAMVNFNLLLGDLRSLERWALLRQPLFIEGNKEYVQIARDLNELTRPDATLAVVTAGAIPYFTDRPSLDLLGKNDAHIAHQPARGVKGLSSIPDFRPGHMKWDYDYSIGELQPDVVVQLWGDSEPAKAYIQKYYTIGGLGDGLTFSFRTGSPRIVWERVQTQP